MTLEELFSGFKSQRIVVIGDVMIDAYYLGNVTRMSPEAPVPIVNLQKKEARLGGAANVACNLVSLGAKVVLCSVIGEDKEGDTLIDLLKKENIDTSGVIRSKERKTTIKTRVLGNNQQLLRVDSEQDNDITSQEEAQMIAYVYDLIENDITGINAIIFQDYNKGVLTANGITKIISKAKEHHVLTSVDPKDKNFFAYKGVTLFKPNLKEISGALGRNIVYDKDLTSLKQGANELQERLSSDIVFVTLSQYGVFISNEKNTYHIEAHHRTITDVSGAGDTVISVATLCLCLGMNMKTIAAIANLAGGIVCEYPGVVTIDADRLNSEIRKLNIL